MLNEQSPTPGRSHKGLQEPQKGKLRQVTAQHSLASRSLKTRLCSYNRAQGYCNRKKLNRLVQMGQVYVQDRITRDYLHWELAQGLR
ncbi:hypothetical protein MHY01S_08490 [Meiothermus hypogaeus NBRC 106114]|uniref:Uncharacterized protein n=1 Tax=Meiothermus hypogaeus NBRC 106114 TaxID=1227553 RepID=A0A511QZ78_9DEIN|nr:hypothetical protein MHY01S_08490 [Meiothermus hypogaeus NBRC 106114]